MRYSRKQVERMAKCESMRLVTHERLGNAKSTWYEYSLVNVDKNDNYIDTVMSCTTLKKIAEYLIEKVLSM